MKLSNQVQSSKSAHHRRGMTLVELMVVMGISSMALAASGAFFLYSFRSLAIITNYVDLDMTSRNALDHLTKNIRQMSLLTSYATNVVTFSGLSNDTMKVSWSPDTRKLTFERPIGSEEKTLLNSCDALVFNMFQRNPKPGTNNFTPTLREDECKMISVNWRCSRVLQGNRLNTETVQTTQIVLRNKS